MDPLLEQLEQRLDAFTAAPFMFVGAGLSRRYLGLDDWSGVLRRLAHLTGRPYEYFCASANEDKPTIASKIAESLHERWWADQRFEAARRQYGGILRTSESALKAEVAAYVTTRLSQMPSSGPLADELSLLRQATVDGFITTNYDPLLETLFPDFRTFVGQEQLLFDQQFGIGEIYKIHGSYENPDSMVITRRDFDVFHDNYPYLAAKLMTIFVEHPIIFVGYSLGDPNVVAILEAIVTCLRTPSRLDELADRLFFVERDSTLTTPSIGRTTIPLNTHELPVSSIRVVDFHDVFAALGRRQRAFPAKLLRQLKERVYELVADAHPQTRLHVVNLDPEIDPREVDVVFGVGVLERVQESLTDSQPPPQEEASEPPAKDLADVPPPDADADADPAERLERLPLEWSHISGVPDTGLLDWGDAEFTGLGLNIPLSDAGAAKNPRWLHHLNLAGKEQAVSYTNPRTHPEEHPQVGSRTLDDGRTAISVSLFEWAFEPKAVRDLIERIAAEAWRRTEIEVAESERRDEEQRKAELEAASRRQAITEAFRALAAQATPAGPGPAQTPTSAETDNRAPADPPAPDETPFRRARTSRRWRV